MNNLQFIALLWSIAGFILMFANLHGLVRIYNDIKVPYKRVVFVLLLALAGGPFTGLLLVLGTALFIVWDFITPPIFSRFNRFIIQPIINWLQK
jgi:hypothetical protein